MGDSLPPLPMHAPRDPAVNVLPRTPQRSTALGQNTAIIYPAADPRYRALADRIAAAITARGGATPECSADTTLIPTRDIPLPAAYRQRPLVLLGNLNTNRVLQPLYADYLCSTDAAYPGGDGYDLRTIHNPYGTGTNVILAGGSSSGCWPPSRRPTPPLHCRSCSNWSSHRACARNWPTGRTPRSPTPPRSRPPVAAG